MPEMKSLTINGKTYEVVDQTARDTANAAAVVNRFNTNLANEYVWSKNVVDCTYTETSYTTASSSTMPFNSTGVTTMRLFNTLLDVYNNNYVEASGYGNDTNFQTTISGKYFKSSKDSYVTVYYVPTTATWRQWNGSYGYAASSCTIYTNIVPVYTVESYVNSAESDAYPPAVSDGYAYFLLGQIGDGLSGAKIATGSYDGTDKYGASNPNTLTFDFVPRIVIVTQDGNNSLAPSGVGTWGGGFMWTYGAIRVKCGDNSNYELVTALNGTTFTWYSANNAYTQQNSTYTYNYIAIG